MRSVTVFCTLLIAACATQPQYRWVKSGANSEQFETDWGYCEAQAAGAPTRDMERVAIVLGGCMKGRGWRLVEQ